MRNYILKVLVYVLVTILVSGEEAFPEGIFIVYPYKEGDIYQVKTTHKFKNGIPRTPKMLNDTKKVHLVYPVEENDTMTSTSIYSSDDNLFDDPERTTEDATELITPLITTSEAAFTDFVESQDEITEFDEHDTVGETTIGDDLFDTTTITTIQTETTEDSKEEPFGLVPNLPLQVETSPKKTLRKRMFQQSMFSRKYPAGLRINNEMKITTTESWYKKTKRNKMLIALMSKRNLQLPNSEKRD